MASLEDLSLVAMAPSTRERVHACLAARKQQRGGGAGAPSSASRVRLLASGSPRQQQQHNSSGRVGGGVGAVAPCAGLLAMGVSVCPQSERNLVGLLDLDLCTVLASVPAARVVVYWRTNVVKSALASAASALSSRSTRRTFVDEATSAVDAALEAEIFERLRTLAETKCIICISHSTALNAMADYRIAIAENGVAGGSV